MTGTLLRTESRSNATNNSINADAAEHSIHEGMHSPHHAPLKYFQNIMRLVAVRSTANIFGYGVFAKDFTSSNRNAATGRSQARARSRSIGLSSNVW